MSIVFARPRHEYASYRDLYRLIDLSGFPTVSMDEIDPASDNTYILTVLNGECQQGWQSPRARIVLWDLEYHLDGVSLPGVELWAGDKWYAECIGAKYVPMGSHPGLADNVASPSAPHYDVAFIGYIVGVHRRERIRQQLIERGVRVSPTGAWGDERHTLLANSTAYLCVHQHDNAPTIAPLRMVVAAAYSLPVITENCADPGVFRHLIYHDDYDHLSIYAEAALTNREAARLLSSHGEALHEFLCCDRTFRKSIEAAL